MTATVIEKLNRPYYFILLRFKDNENKDRQKWIKTDIPIKGNNKKKIESERVRVLREYEEAPVDLSHNISFVEFIKEWLENLKPSIALVTYDTYRLIIYRQIVPFFESKNLKVREVTPNHIQQYIRFKLKTVSPNTVRKHLFNISKCLDSAVKQNLISINPVKQIDMPKKEKFMGAKFYSEDEIVKLLEVSRNDKLHLVIYFAVFYGLRRSEILGLRWDAIDFENNIFTIRHTVVRIDKVVHKKNSTKTKSSYRVMPMPLQIKEALIYRKNEQILEKNLQPNDYKDEGYIFTKIDGQILDPNFVSKHFKRILIANNMPVIRFHDLRHSSASYLLYLGFSLKEIQSWLGHGDIGTTMNVYAHLDTNAKKIMADSLSEKLIHSQSKI